VSLVRFQPRAPHVARVSVCRHPDSGAFGATSKAKKGTGQDIVDEILGLGNRFLWVRLRRNAVHPDGGNLTSVDFSDMAKAIREAARSVSNLDPMRRDDEAAERWNDWYRPNAQPEKHGLYDAATARDEARTLRMSIIHALLDGQAVIERRHIDAAIAVWNYCDESARGLFGATTSNKDVDRLAEELHTVGTAGLDGRGLNRLFGGNSSRAARARHESIRLHIAVEGTEKTRGRPRSTLYERKA
jgi:hypothetical protein